jgi:pimeloyl-ACP methyl ester carboxylesterase
MTTDTRTPAEGATDVRSGSVASSSYKRTPLAGAQARQGQDGVLGEAIDAPRAELLNAEGWRVAYYADKSAAGRPLVLVHSINAAPSSFEVKPLFEHYRSSRPVYSLDLPGFGHSERRPSGYSPEFFAQTLTTFLDRIVGEPADVIALSLGAEFAARAVASKPELAASLVLIAPTGFMGRPPPSPKVGRIAHKVLKTPGLSQGLFALVTSKPSIRYYLGRSFVGKPPRETLDYAYATAHQPGARHAPLVFLSMQLFTPDAIDRFYAKLTGLPVLVIADREPYIDFERLDDFVSRHPNWSRERVAPNMGLPQWERLTETVAVLDAFWAQSAA